MTESRDTVEQHADPVARGEQPADEEQAPTPDASAAGGGAPGASAKGATDGRLSREPSDSGGSGEDGVAADPKDVDEEALRRDADEGALRGHVDEEAPQGHVDEEALQGDVDELVAVAAQRDEYLALAQRTQADFENYRKRVAKESAEAGRRGAVKLAKELLPALDNLDRALAEADAVGERDGGDGPLLEGVRLVRSELHAALARVGIESFSPVGAAFDPAEHEAMAQQPVEGAESGTVVEVFQPGYKIGESIIRPARVLVAA